MAPLLKQIWQITPEMRKAVQRQGWDDLSVLDTALWYEPGEYESPDESMTSICIVPDKNGHCEGCHATLSDRRREALEKKRVFPYSQP
jgi:hypothetical protein